MSAAEVDERCGTYAEYQAHLRRDETPCDACRQAKRDYMSERRKNREVRRVEMEQQQARLRAFWRLSRMYPTAYRALYAEESAGIVIPPRKKREPVKAVAR
jgi:hypothetical protein